jgi:hypothetical protein
MVYP